MPDPLPYDITRDDLGRFAAQSAGRGPAFVTFGEVMVRDTPADMERPERTRLVRLSMAGSEYTLAMGLARLGISAAYITRVPDNPYGRAVRNIAREQGVNTDYLVWAAKTEPIGRFIYEIGRTPRKNTGIYQRMYSAASRLGAGMVDWAAALRDAALFHTSGISFGLAAHSNYERNYNHEAFQEAIAAKPAGCLVGLDFNYRATLWSPAQARQIMTPIVAEQVDVLVTTIEDMARLYGLDCGQYTAQQIVDGDMGAIDDDDIRAFAEEVHREFRTQVVAITIRYPDSFEQHRWESAAVDADGHFFRSPAVRPITLLDRLGGGDTWNAGFYYGLLTEGLNQRGLEKGVLVGDAATRLKQTVMFDLPMVDKAEIQALLKEDVAGGGKRTAR
jgi:2-dehydro-3-deoxygluconokinase